MSSFSSLDSRPTILTPFHHCSFAPPWSNLQPPQLFRFVPLPSSLLHTQHYKLSRFHHIRQAPSSSRHRPNVQTAHSPAITVQMSHKKTTVMSTKYYPPQKENQEECMSFISEENDIHLFTGSIMDPFKTGATVLFATALVSLGKSGRFHLVWYQNRAAIIANRPVSFYAKCQFTMASISSVR